MAFKLGIRRREGTGKLLGQCLLGSISSTRGMMPGRWVRFRARWYLRSIILLLLAINTRVCYTFSLHKPKVIPEPSLSSLYVFLSFRLMKDLSLKGCFPISSLITLVLQVFLLFRIFGATHFSSSFDHLI